MTQANTLPSYYVAGQLPGIGRGGPAAAGQHAAPTQRRAPKTLDELNREFVARFGIERENRFPALPGLAPYVPPAKRETRDAIYGGAQADSETNGGFEGLPPLSIFDPESPENTEPPEREKKGKKTLRIISTVLFYTFIVCLIGGAVFLARGGEGKRPFLGYSFMHVLTPSMQSVIPQDSLVINKSIDPNDLKPGDIITYMQDEDTAVTHRVIAITENYEDSGERGFETKGDENDAPDFDIVPAIHVVGIVRFHVPRVGGWLAWIQENLFILLGFTVGIILFFILLKGALKKSPEEKAEKHARSKKKQAA